MQTNLLKPKSINVEQLGVNRAKVTLEPETLKAMPLKMVHRRNLIPLSRDNGTLVVATGDPYDVYSLDEQQTLTGLHCE